MELFALRRARRNYRRIHALAAAHPDNVSLRAEEERMRAVLETFRVRRA
jgi:hypothetical protein